jgi:hypothetical protein
MTGGLMTIETIHGQHDGHYYIELSFAPSI